MSFCMRRLPKTCWNWLAVINWNRLPVRNIIPVQPATIRAIVMRAQNRRIDWGDLAIADRIDRENNHIDCIVQTPSRGHIGQRGRDGDGQHESQASDQISQRGGEKLNHRSSNSAPKQLTR